MATHLGVVPEFLPEKHDVIPNIPPSIFKGPMGWRCNTVHDGIFGDCGGTSMGYSSFNRNGREVGNIHTLRRFERRG